MEIVKLLDEGAGEWGVIQLILGIVQFKIEGFVVVVVVYLFVCLSRMVLLWSGFLMGIFKSSLNYFWVFIIVFFVYSLFIFFLGNKFRG